MTSARELQWPDLVWSHFSRPRFGAFDERVAAAAPPGSPGSACSSWSTSGCGTRRVARPLTSAGSSTTTGWCSPRSRPCPGGPRAATSPPSADAGRTWRTSDRRPGLPLPAGHRALRGVGRRRCGGVRRPLRPRRRPRAAVGIEWLPYTNIATAADAQAIVEGAARPNGGYCADIWHHKRGADDESFIRALPATRCSPCRWTTGPASRSWRTTSATACSTASRPVRASSTVWGSSAC